MKLTKKLLSRISVRVSHLKKYEKRWLAEQLLGRAYASLGYLKEAGDYFRRSLDGRHVEGKSSAVAQLMSKPFWDEDDEDNYHQLMQWERDREAGELADKYLNVPLTMKDRRQLRKLLIIRGWLEQLMALLRR